jgi:cysteine desulfurase/selenocysteine lyase
MDTVERNVLKNSSYLIETLGESKNFTLVTPESELHRAGIVTFRPRRVDTQALHQYLTGKGVVCAQRAGGIRLSPHFYTPIPSLERVVEWLDKF